MVILVTSTKRNSIGLWGNRLRRGIGAPVLWGFGGVGAYSKEKEKSKRKRNNFNMTPKKQEVNCFTTKKQPASLNS